MLQRSSEQPVQGPEETVRPTSTSWQQPTVDLREMARILRRRYRLVLLPALVLGSLALTWGRCRSFLVSY